MKEKCSPDELPQSLPHGEPSGPDMPNPDPFGSGENAPHIRHVLRMFLKNVGRSRKKIE